MSKWLNNWASDIKIDYIYFENVVEETLIREWTSLILFHEQTCFYEKTLNLEVLYREENKCRLEIDLNAKRNRAQIDFSLQKQLPQKLHKL